MDGAAKLQDIAITHPPLLRTSPLWPIVSYLGRRGLGARTNREAALDKLTPVRKVAKCPRLVNRKVELRH